MTAKNEAASAARKARQEVHKCASASVRNDSLVVVSFPLGSLIFWSAGIDFFAFPLFSLERIVPRHKRALSLSPRTKDMLDGMSER